MLLIQSIVCSLPNGVAGIGRQRERPVLVRGTNRTPAALMVAGGIYILVSRATQKQFSSPELHPASGIGTAHMASSSSKTCGRLCNFYSRKRPSGQDPVSDSPSHAQAFSIARERNSRPRKEQPGAPSPRRKRIEYEIKNSTGATRKQWEYRLVLWRDDRRCRTMSRCSEKADTRLQWVTQTNM